MMGPIVALLAAGLTAFTFGASPGTTRAPARAGSGTVTVREVQVGTAMLIEGAVSTVEISRYSHPVFTGRWVGPVDVTTHIPPGRWRVSRSEQPCDGNCDNLDAPTATCSRGITVRAGRRVVIEVLVDQTKPHCRMRVVG